MIYLIIHIYQDFITTTIVNKFRIQYFGSLLCLSGLLSEREILIVFGFSFPVIFP